MKGFYNRALFYKEYKIITHSIFMLIPILLYELVWKLSLLIGLMKFIQTDEFANYLYQDKYIPESEYVKVLVSNYFFKTKDVDGLSIIFGMLLFGISVFCYDRFISNSLDIYAMPFSRKSIIGTRWITTTIIFMAAIIFILIIMLMTCAVYWKVIYEYFSYMDVCRFMFIYFLIGVFVISVAMLGQCISGNMIIGGFISLVLLYFDRIIIFATMESAIVFPSLRKLVQEYLDLYGSFESNPIIKYSILNKFANNYEEGFLIRSLILIILIITICVISIFLYNNAQVYIEGDIFVNKAVERVINGFIYGIIILFISSMAILYINPKSISGRYITTILGLAIGILIIKVFKKNVWDRLLYRTH